MRLSDLRGDFYVLDREKHRVVGNNTGKVISLGDKDYAVDGKRVEAGEELTYSITYKNTTGEKVTVSSSSKLKT